MERIPSSCVSPRVHDAARVLSVVVALTASCERDPRPSTAPTPAAPAAASGPAGDACLDAACSTQRAAAAAAAGQPDLASRYLGQAYRRDPTAGRLSAWLDALRDSGQHRALAVAIGEHGERHRDVVAGYAPTPGDDRPTRARDASADVMRALVQERRGELEAAADGLADASHPAWLARRGVVLDALGDGVAAAEAFADARIELDERGATFELVPFDASYAPALGWLDDHAVRIVEWRPINAARRSAVIGAEHLTAGDGFDVAQTLLFPAVTHRVVDGRLYGATASGIELFDIRTGGFVGAPALSPAEGSYQVAIDHGEDRRYLATVAGQQIEIRQILDTGAVEATPLGTFQIAGLTPTITRVYTGEGTHHDNILNDDPSWPVAFAISEDERKVAIGVSDSTVQLFGVGRRGRKTLEIEWEYSERRIGGGNPDHNQPRALVFDGDELVAVFARGDIVRWSAKGSKLDHRPGDCSAQELDAYARRYGGEPEPVTKRLRASCQRVEHAWFSPTAARLATTGGFDLRVVETRSGASLQTFRGGGLGAQSVAWADEGALVFSNAYGQVWQWREGEGVVSRTGTRDGMDTGPRSPRLSDDLQVLEWGGDYRPLIAWNLGTGKAQKRARSGGSGTLSRHVRLDAVRSGDGTREAQMDDEGVIRVRDTGSGGVGRTIKTRDARGEIAIAPDGSWLAWQEQLEPERGSLPSLVVHLVPLNRRRKERTITVKGWGDQLAADPRGGELMVLTENTITRWNLRTDAATDEGFGYVGVNAAHYSADAALLIMEAFNKVELRANEPGLPLVATIFALDNGGWFALTEHGAVDGSANATERLATIVTGPKDHAVLPGAVAWDRLAVPHMMAEPQGYLAYPPGSL